MVQTVEMTEDEQVEMYMKLTKREIISMLMENQRLVKHFTLIKSAQFVHIPLERKQCSGYSPNPQSTGMECLFCGQSKYQH